MDERTKLKFKVKIPFEEIEYVELEKTDPLGTTLTIIGVLAGLFGWGIGNNFSSYIQLRLTWIKFFINRKFKRFNPGIRLKITKYTYEVEWNYSDFPSGIYFYNLLTGNIVETRKMTLLR